MANYIDILVTKDGYFCAAPPWMIKEGDLICLPNAIGGDKSIHEVVSVATDSTEGDFVKLVERYIGYPLPKIHAKFNRCEVEWDASDNDR